MQFLLIFQEIDFKFHKCMGGSHIKRVLSCNFQITLENGNIDGGGRECNFSLTIMKENCLLLQLPINTAPPTLLMLESPNLYA